MSPLAVSLFSLIIILPLQNKCIRARNQDVPDVPLNDAETKALLKFMNVSHSNSFNWNLSEPACSWKGVYCYSENNFTTVLHLRLPGKSFVGQIPLESIGVLTSLRVLSLRYNGLFGEIPLDFSNLTSLTRLSLNNNRLSGSIPKYFSEFTKLNLLALNNNNFTGNLPDIKAKELDTFDVSFNNLNTRIPPSLSKFDISAFDGNLYLCEKPSSNKCNASYPAMVEEKKRKNMTPLIVGVSVGSALILLVLLSQTRKKVYQQPPKQIPSQKEDQENDFVLFEHERIRRLDMEVLLKASALLLGDGSVGRSYKQVLDGENTTVVVKWLKNVVVTQNEFKKTMDVLGQMEHHNVVRLIAYSYSKYDKWLVYDYMSGGSLYDHLHGNIASGQRQLDWDQRMRIALSSAKGLKYLHAKNVIHGNIKSSNILIQQKTNSEASVADYGLSTIFNGSSSLNDQRDTCKVTFKSDVYSFGVVLLQLLTSQIPKQELSNKEVPFSKWVESTVCKEPREIFDVELKKYHNEEMMQLFEIAKYCVSSVPDQNSIMRDVMSKMENMCFRQSSDDHSKGYDDTPSTDTRDTPSTISHPSA